MADLPIGLQDQLVTAALQQVLADMEAARVHREPLEDAEAPVRLARYAMDEIRTVLAAGGTAEQQAIRVNDLLRLLGDGAGVKLPPEILTGVLARSRMGDFAPLPPRPATPLSQSDLLVNAEGQPNIGSELRAELASADSVDLLCAFVIWSGVRPLREAITGVIHRGGRLRVITTTYMGATEKRAVDELCALGAEVKVALDARTTKLHAKAWLLERASGLTTAFVGSSNLSRTALFDGLEWNVRLSSSDAGHVVDRVRMMFESHWASEHFSPYDPARDGAELERALKEFDRRSLGEASTISFANLEVRPYPHQRRMLEALMVERERHNRHKNLVVAATGTGKTVVAGLDYRQLVEAADQDLSLLFVAHREEILRQSLATYRAIMRDGSFGEIHGGGRVAAGHHVFGMIQSLGKARLEQLAPEAFDVVVIDEFHHAAAATYDRLLGHLAPRELLGLTATPERLDGKDVTTWFEGRIAVELRLWEAIDEGFLVPFQYFGVADGTDLSSLPWRRGGYPTDELSNVLTGDDARVGKLLQAIQQIVLEPSAMRALGFCVSVEHARYMARKFTDAGLRSVAVTGEDSPSERVDALRRLRAGELRCVFSVEVLGEGVDVPDVDCILLLRPTASATVFSQQLGRGLRRAKGKSHLTVIDLIGQHRREFRFEDRLRAILDTRRGPVERQVRDDFPFLPSGCTLQLDRQSRDLILDNLREAARRSQRVRLVADLRREQPEIGMSQFLQRYAHRMEDIYRNTGSWTLVRREAGWPLARSTDPGVESGFLKNLCRLTHVDDPERVAFYRAVLEKGAPPHEGGHDIRHSRLLTMLAWGLGSGSSPAASVPQFLAALWTQQNVRAELLELLTLLDERSHALARPAVMPPDVPLTLHARYSRQEVIAALGFGDGPKPKVTQGGILWVPQQLSDVFFVDLQKAERDYSPTTMYRDYAINRQFFHWESQSRQASTQRTVQRYINHVSQGSRVLLFVRERKSFELGTRPFTFLGPVRYVNHHGDRPVAFTWELPEPMPESLFEVARSVAA